MKRALIIFAVVALLIGVCFVAVSDRSRGKVVIDFVSVTNELGFDVITFTISNRANVPVSGVYGVQWRASNAWVNILSDTFMQRYQLAPRESSTIDMPWRGDLYSWRLHASVRPGYSAFEQWRSRVAFRFRSRPRLMKAIAPPAIRQHEIADGPEMRMKRPAEKGKGTGA